MKGGGGRGGMGGHGSETGGGGDGKAQYSQAELDDAEDGDWDLRGSRRGWEGREGGKGEEEPGKKTMGEMEKNGGLGTRRCGRRGENPS